MSFPTLLLIALGVSADAFAVAVGKGLTMPRLDWRAAVTLAAVFGLFQAAMPALGWLLGSGFARYIVDVDHWIAFGLLALIGGKMLRESRQPHGAGRASLPWRELLVLAVATSIDALAVGISFAFLDVHVLAAVVLIGVVTSATVFGGVVVGSRAGARWRGPAEVVGGLVLIGIGVQILVEHLSAG